MTRWLLWAGVIGPVVFVLGFVVIGLLRPDYDANRHFISLLSLTDAGWQQTANFAVSGVLMAAGGLGMWQVLPSRAVSALVAVAGIGLTLAGVFPIDPGYGYPPGAPPGIPTSVSTSGLIHLVVVTVAFLALPAANVILARRLQEAGGVWRIYSWLTAVATIGFLVSALLVTDATGLLHRLGIVIAMAWVARLSLALLRQVDEEPAA